MDLLKTPIKDLTPEQIMAAHELRAQKDARVRKENEEYGPIKTGLHIISDDLGVQGVVNPVDGKRYDSKSRYYKAISDSGAHIVEAGEKPQKQGLGNIKEDLRQAYQQLS